MLADVGCGGVEGGGDGGDTGHDAGAVHGAHVETHARHAETDDCQDLRTILNIINSTLTGCA